MSCSLARRLAVILDDGTGQVAPHLAPLFARVTSMTNPLSAMTWLNKSAVRQRLASLASGETPLTHEGVDTLCGTQGREFLRELLCEVGLLPNRDKYLAVFTSWKHRRLTSLADPVVRREVTIYVAWRQERDLAVRSGAGRLTAAAANNARDRIDAAVRFLEWLGIRGRVLAELRQDDIDAFFAEASNPSGAFDFLIFAVAHRRCPKVRLPAGKRASSPGVSLSRINELVCRLLDDESIELADRVSGLLVLLLAQRFSRIVELRIGDFTEQDGTVSLTLGQDSVPLPVPVAALVSRYLAARFNMTTTNTATDFVFPGGRPGAHITAAWLTKRLNALGITKLERQGALNHLVSEAPPSIVARATGYAVETTSARALLSGSDWAHYAALASARGR